VRRRRGWLALALAAALPAAAAVAQYSQTTPSRDGTGRVYMGREIAHVMGHQGAAWLERPERAREEQPERVLQAMQLKRTDVVADIGAGTGYFSTRIAALVPDGKVLGVDIQPEMLELLSRAAAARELTNIQPVQGSPADPHLAPASIDKALLVDAYHEFDQPRAMMEGIVRALKPGGEVVLVEYRGEDDGVPILPHHKMTEAQVSREMAAVGLKLVRRVETLPWQHILVYGRSQKDRLTTETQRKGEKNSVNPANSW
jgi:SAM-dependent methyltransferase